MEANALDGTSLCAFKTAWEFRVQVVGFGDGDLPERVSNPERGAPTCWVHIVTPCLLDGLRLDLGT